MANQWFKFYGGEYLADPKMAALSPQERSCWLTLLCLASMATTQGEIGFLTVEVLLTKSGIQFDPYNPEEWNNNLGVLKKFEKMNMVALTDGGEVIIKNWEKRQEHNLTVAERVAKHRAKKANVTIDVTNVTTEENRIEENNTSETRVSQRKWEIKPEDEKPRKEKKDTTYLKVFELWTDYPLHWRKNVTEIEAAKNLLVESNLPDMKVMLKNYERLKDQPYCPSILKPSDLDRKWDNLIEFKKKHG